MPMTRGITACLGLLFAPIQAFSVDRCVDNGSLEQGASWSGMAGAPYASEHCNGPGFATVQAALNDNLQAGDSVIIRGGIYKEHAIRLPASHGDSWEDGHFNTIASYPGEWAVLDGENDLESDWSVMTWPSVLGTSESAFYWLFERLELRNGATSNGEVARGFCANSGPFKFRFCYIHDNLAPSDTAYGNVPAGLNGHNWSDSLVEFCAFEKNGVPPEFFGNDNVAHILIYGPYNLDTIIANGYTDEGPGTRVANNVFRYNYFGEAATGIRDTKSAQLLCGRNPAANHGYDDTYKTYGDNIHHNIFRGIRGHSIVTHQDFVQVHHNIIQGGTSPISLGTTEIVQYKSIAYNNTILDTPGSAIACFHNNIYGSNEKNFYGYVFNNVASNCASDYSMLDMLEEFGLYLEQGNFPDAEFTGFKLTNNYSYNPGKHARDPNGDLIVQIASRKYTAQQYATEVDGSAKLWLSHDTSQPLFQGTSGAAQFITRGDHALSGGATIANAGLSGNHPYLDNIAIPSYIGATDPSAENQWVQAVLDLAYLDQNGIPVNLRDSTPGGGDPPWVTDAAEGGGGGGGSERIVTGCGMQLTREIPVWALVVILGAGFAKLRRRAR